MGLREAIQRSPDSASLHELRREYGDRALAPDDLDRNPITQFGAWLDDARASAILEPNAMTLATVDEEGRPDARIVLLKELRPEGFVFYSGYESAKGVQLAANPAVALAFFWDALERQVRITGAAERLAATESDAYFEKRPVKSRIAAVASPQSRVVESRGELETRFAETACIVGATDRVARPASWGGYLVRPRTIEFWQGRRSRLHDRLVYTRGDDGWTLSRLAP